MRSLFPSGGWAVLGPWALKQHVSVTASSCAANALQSHDAYCADARRLRCASNTSSKRAVGRGAAPCGMAGRGTTPGG